MSHLVPSVEWNLAQPIHEEKNEQWLFIRLT